MVELDSRDVCRRQHELYLQNRDSHRARSVGPDGVAHDVDVLRLLCLNEITDFGLQRARYSSDSCEVAATADVEQGDVVTFYPGDSAQYWPPDAQSAVSLRLCSDRVRSRIGEWHPGSRDEMHEVGDNFYIAGHPDFASDRNYLGHVIRRAENREDANAAMACFRGIAMPVVALRNITAGEEILL